MVGVGAGAGAGAAFAGNTGENWGGPVFFDGFVFCLAFLPVAWSFRRRSWSPGEPLLILVDGDAAFLPADVGRGIVRKVSDPPWLPEARHTLFLVRIPKSEINPSMSMN